jgi:Na+-translocating ferredoxin:NAD+ oxidoreductase subunit G
MSQFSISLQLGKLRSQVRMPLLLLLVSVVGLLTANALTKARALEARKEFDRRNLQELFQATGYDNDLLLDTFLLTAHTAQDQLVRKDLLGLQRDRLAYIARYAGEVVAIAVPATAEDGFNGFIDLLIAADMSGRISAARVLKSTEGDALYGVVDIIESKWMKGFDGNSMRDTRRVSWQIINPEQEYDQFVGASLTPKSVAARIYDALVFFQSNRIVLMNASMSGSMHGIASGRDD